MVLGPPQGMPPNPLLPGVMPGRPPVLGPSGLGAVQPPAPPPVHPVGAPVVTSGGPGRIGGPGGPTGLGTPDALAKALAAAGIEVGQRPAMLEPEFGRDSPRGAYDHVYEIVAHDLAQWLHKMPKILATAMRGGPHKQGPFMHAATGQQKYEIFRRKLFNDDGTPNMEGRQELLQKLTPRQYAEVVHIVSRQMKRSGEAGEGVPPSPMEALDEQR